MGIDGAVIQLATRCASADEFVERFARFASETDVVVPAVADVSVGTAGRFEIRLKDQSVIMAGRCEVTEVLPMADAPDAPGAPAAPPRPARALMRLRLIEMDAHSTGIHLRLTERRASSVKPASAPAPPSAPAPARPLSVRSLSIVRTPPPRTIAPAVAFAPPLPSRPSSPSPSPINATAAAPPTSARAAAPPQLVRSVPMPTLIGVPAPVAPPATTAAVAPPVRTAAATTAAGTSTAATTAAAAAAPSAWEIESTEVSAPRKETRVPGAAFTLPANPLSDLDGADLASFIELKLLEIEGVDSAAIVIGQPVGTETPAPDGAASSPPVSAARWDGRLEQARRIARRYGPYASVLVVGLLAGLWLRSGAKAPPVVAPPPPVVVPSEIVQPEPPPAAAPVAAAKIPPAARAECVARVTTKPAGAAVFWGDVALGPSPIENAPVRCGDAVVTVKHERYADLTRTITAERGRSAVVSERLARPPGKVMVTSSPPGARIKLNRHAFGEAPRKISTLRFERVRIDASLPGHQPWSKTFYMRDAETIVAVTLTPVPKPNARRATAPRK